MVRTSNEDSRHDDLARERILSVARSLMRILRVARALLRILCIVVSIYTEDSQQGSPLPRNLCMARGIVENSLHGNLGPPIENSQYGLAIFEDS
ncbi:hypothetical protein LINPERPRIM_LOCUS9347 [Linum perenne]